jgi:multidrug efflux pump subunit AcrB
MPVETAKIFRDMGAAGITALIGIFVIISLIFNSYKKTFIIIFVIPFSLIGIVFALVTHGLPMSTLAGVSMLGLMGVVVNDGIVMVDTITRMAQDGDIFIGGIVEGAVSRLRPVLLTSLTTIFGLLPTGYGIGGYDPMLSDMCLVMAYGLAAGTMITMFLIPIYYMIGMDIRKVMANIMLPGFLRRG